MSKDHNSNQNSLFLEVLHKYISRMPADPCYDQALAFYSEGLDLRPLTLDRLGSPIQQLKTDGKAEKAGFLLETAEAIEKGKIYVWHPLARPAPTRPRVDRFVDSAAKFASRLDFAPKSPVILSMENGVSGELESRQSAKLSAWLEAYAQAYQAYRAECLRTGVKGYKEISLFTFAGFAGGLGLGAALDALGATGSAIGEWAVRTISGEGEDLAEGFWVLRKRLARRQMAKPAAEPASQAEEPEEEPELEEEGFVWFEDEDEDETGAAQAYGTGKIVGMAAPWVIDFGSRLAGVDVHAPEGSYVAYFYSLADQLFATINGFRFHVRKAGTLWGGVRGYFSDPVMVSSFLVVTIPFAGVFMMRSLGWRPSTLFLAAVEGVLLNLCWIPPLTAWGWDWHLQRGLRKVEELCEN